MSNRAWVTLATNDSYGLGALVLAHSLRRANTAHPAVVLITPSVTEAMRNRLSAVFAEVITVNVLDSQDAAHLALLQRPELGITFTKIHCWTLTQYQKCVFLDADTLIVQNCDELFERDELSAAPDVGWPDCFNSGVFVFVPSQETYSRLITFAQERGSFDGGDQGLLNAFFADWAHGDIKKHLPFLYNVTSAAFYSYIPALKHYGQDLKIIHFIGAAKPWLQQFNWQSRSVDAPEHLKQFLQLWWDLFVSQVHSQLDSAMESAVDEEQGPLEPPPENPPEDSQHHYAPEITADSEFPWHWPENSIQETEYQEQNENMIEIHDPWRNYRGTIPPKQDYSSQRSDFGGVQNEEEIRKYAWEYQESYDKNAWQQKEHFKDHDHHSHHRVSDTQHHTHQFQHHEPNSQYDNHQMHQYQNSGVAGNLARVVPGSSSHQSEAIDELTRRQGWEAGNIDYMGADSFDNIWAKISQTLSQQPPKQPSPPRKEPTPPKEPSPPKQQTQPEAAPKPVEQPAPATTSPVTPEAAPPQAPKTGTPASPPPEAPKTEAPAPAPAPAAPAPIEVAKPVKEALATEPPKEQPTQKTEATVPPTPPATPKSTPEATSPVTESAPEVPKAVACALAKPASSAVAAEAPAVPVPEKPTAIPEKPAATPEKPVAAPEKPVATPEKPQDSSVTTTSSTDSPPLANTPSKDDPLATVSPTKSEERRKPVEKLQLRPPAAADPLPTPDSELEDAAALAHAIIASELSTSVTASTPAADVSPPPQLEEKCLSVEAPELPTPPVSLAQIGVKPKGKPTTAAQIESSISPAAQAPATPETPASPAPAASESSAPATPTSATAPATPSEAGKKKTVKKVTKKEAGPGGDTPTPVPPPRKKEKKPKEK